MDWTWPLMRNDKGVYWSKAMLCSIQRFKFKKRFTLYLDLIDIIDSMVELHWLLWLKRYQDNMANEQGEYQ